MALAAQGLQRRTVVVLLSFLSIFICYIDRVNISVAIIPMAEELGWSPQTQGTVLSSFFLGYLLLQIVGGRLADRFGGKIVLGVGVDYAIRRSSIKDHKTIEAAAGDVYTTSEFYAEKRAEVAPGDDADKHILTT